jgi:hypothetical protein
LSGRRLATGAALRGATGVSGGGVPDCAKGAVGCANDGGFRGVWVAWRLLFLG